MPTYLNDDQQEKFVAAAAYDCGDLLVGPSGKVVQVQNSNGVAIGDMIAGQRYGRIKIANSGISPSGGDTIGYDATAKNGVAAGTGDFDIGIAAAAVTSPADIEVFLNE